MKDKIRKILWDFVAGELTDSEATQQVMDLFDVNGTVCDYCGSEVNLQIDAIVCGTCREKIGF